MSDTAGTAGEKNVELMAGINVHMALDLKMLG